MQSIGLEIMRNGRRYNVLKLLREQIWGNRIHRLGRKSDRKELADIYRKLEKKKMKLEKQIYLIEYEIHKFEELAKCNRRKTLKVNFKKSGVSVLQGL